MYVSALAPPLATQPLPPAPSPPRLGGTATAVPALAADGVSVRSPASGYVAHGSLFVAAPVEAPFEDAERYLSRDSAMHRILQRAESARQPITVTTPGAGQADTYSPATRTVTWSPHLGYRVGDHAVISPAIALGHELDHATVDPSVAARGEATGHGDRWLNDEERRVITGSENHAERTLHEPVRTSHHAEAPVYVARPTDHETP